MKYSIASTLSLSFLAICCNGTETQNPAQSGGAPGVVFGNSGCKKELLTATSKGVSTFSQVDAGGLNFGDDIAGLKCVAWERIGSDGLRVNLINFEETCGAVWQGAAQVESPTQLQLSLTNPQCTLARCGYCIFDWSFDVTGMPIVENLPTTITIDVCPGVQDIKTASLELPLSTASSGIKCNYANFSALGWQAMALGTCGTLGMPCNGTMMCPSTDAGATARCEDNLVCTNNGDTTQEICAKPCVTDTGCGASGINSCRGGLCRPSNTW